MITLTQNIVERLTARILTRKVVTVIMLRALAGKFSFTLVRPVSSKKISMFESWITF